jgi:hypothetical protein
VHPNQIVRLANVGAPRRRTQSNIKAVHRGSDAVAGATVPPLRAVLEPS